MKNKSEAIIMSESQAKNLSTKVSVETLKILDALAQRADISRSKLIHNIIESTIDEMDMGRKIGFLQMVILIRNVNSKISGSAGKGKKNETQKEERTIPVRLAPEYHEKLEILAKIADRTPHYLMRNFLQVGAEELNTTLVKGVLPLALLIRDLRDKIVALCDKGEKAIESYDLESK